MIKLPKGLFSLVLHQQQPHDIQSAENKTKKPVKDKQENIHTSKKKEGSKTNNCNFMTIKKYVCKLLRANIKPKTEEKKPAKVKEIEWPTVTY